MPDRVRKRQIETPRKPKTCKGCGRTFAWQGQRDWDVVKHCSAECSGYKAGDVDKALEAAILDLLAQRDPGKTICPSEAAKAVGGKESRRDWEGLMEPARAAARRLVREGKVVVTQRGQVVDAETAKGAIRLRLR